MIVDVEASAVQFSVAVRVLASTARRLGLTVPGFRSPPRVEGADRTLRRGAGPPLVSVRRRGRPWAVVLADLIDGVLAANELAGASAEPARAALWGAAEAAGLVVDDPDAPGGPHLVEPLPGAGHVARVARRPSLRALPGGALGAADPRRGHAA